MSRRMKRVSFSVVISLIVLAGVYTSVLGASPHAGTMQGSVRLTAGLTADLQHARYQAPVLQSYYSDLNTPSSNQHDCNSDFRVDPND